MLSTGTVPKLQAIMAAILFGASAPLAKLLLGNIQPVMLAALLYLGCGLGLFTLRLLRNLFVRSILREAGLTSPDIPWLMGAILAGGVAAPIILMFSLKNTPAATASLLLNFEGVATSLIAVLLFKEALGKRVWAAVAIITLASIVLTLDGKGAWGFSIGAAGVLLACIFWGIDNNFTRNISAKDPLLIVIIKGSRIGIICYRHVHRRKHSKIQRSVRCFDPGIYQLRYKCHSLYPGHAQPWGCQVERFFCFRSFCRSFNIFASI